MSIQDVYEKHKIEWFEKNKDFFGIIPLESDIMTLEKIHAHISSCEENWNGENPCELARMVLNGDVSKDSHRLVKGSFNLIYNEINGCTDLYGQYAMPDGETHVTRLIASLPTPNANLSWCINRAFYTPRITASVNYSLICKESRKDGKQIVSQLMGRDNSFKYNLETKTFSTSLEDAMEKLSKESRLYLQAVYGKKIMKSNFEKALHSLPERNEKSTYFYRYDHLDVFFDIIRSKRKFANPLKKIHLAVNSIFLKHAGYNDVNPGAQLIITKSPISALESYRTVVKKVNDSKKGQFLSSFSFVDTDWFFDAFKTTTNKAAGRHRLLLDNVEVKDGLLYYTDENGEVKDMYKSYGKDKTNDSISSISWSMFCNNNDPKRIMMTAKLSTQAIATEASKDNFTNKLDARVVFGEYEGWSFADSIIISESFAEKLRGINVQSIDLKMKDNPELFNKVKNNEPLNINDWGKLFGESNKNVIKSYEDIEILSKEIGEYFMRLIVKYTIPFSVGDKISSMHGAKGVVGKILPDNEMPYLKNDIGDFKAGPFEVIISGFSTMRRGSMGQILEAWARASGIEFEPGDDYAKNAIIQHSEAMKDFSAKSIIQFNGSESIKPCGVIEIIRLYHHASSKMSTSYLKTNINKMLKLGEMEKINLVANELYNTLEELAIRSTHKRKNSYYLIYNLYKNRILERDVEVSSKFARMLKSMGIQLEVSGQAIIESDMNVYDKSYQTSSEEYKAIDKSVFESIKLEIKNNDLIDLESFYEKYQEQINKVG